MTTMLLATIALDLVLLALWAFVRRSPSRIGRDASVAPATGVFA